MAYKNEYTVKDLKDLADRLDTLTTSIEDMADELKVSGKETISLKLLSVENTLFDRMAYCIDRAYADCLLQLDGPR